MTDYRHDILGPNGLSTASETFTMKSPLIKEECVERVLLVHANVYATGIGGYEATPDKTFSEVVEAANNDAVILCKMDLTQLFSASGPVKLTLPLTYTDYASGRVEGHGIVNFFGVVYCVYFNWISTGRPQLQKFKLTIDKG